MALTKDDAVIAPYQAGLPPYEPSIFFIMEELRKIERTLRHISNICPQVAISEPETKLTGMIRWNKSPWDPLGTGDGLVKWNGTAWTAV